nr:MATE family efflux transporter [Clostridia bacterium]
GVALRPMLTAFGATESIMPYALPYTAIIVLGLPFMVFTTGAAHMIRADGSPRYAMGIMVSGAVFNVIFDPVFLFVFDMGIEGIAWATTLGQILTAILAAVYLARGMRSVSLTRREMRPRLSHAKAIAALGSASCFNQLAMTVVQIALNNSLRHYGALSAYGSEIPLACVGALSKLNVLFMAFVIGISQGNQPIISYNYGAENHARVREALRIAITAATACSLLAFALFQGLPRQALALFGKQNSAAYFEFGIRYLRIYMLLTFLNGIQPVVSNFFTSIGKAKTGLFLSMTRQILFLLPLILLFPLLFGIDGLLYAGPLADLASFIAAILLMRRELALMRKLETKT